MRQSRPRGNVSTRQTFSTISLHRPARRIVRARGGLGRVPLAFVGLGAFCCHATALAQAPSAFPQRNVQLVVPYTPGTGADIVARALAPKLAERWKAGVITDNRPGATGIIGTDLVAKAAPGHVLLMTATGRRA